MNVFRRRLAALHDPAAQPSRWVYVPWDQLSDRIGPLAATDPNEIGIVLVESLWKPRIRPYHQQKLALVLASQRHFALEQARRGVAIRYHASAASYTEVLRAVIADVGPLEMMRAAEFELRGQLAPLIAEGGIRVVPHEGWLTTTADFEAAGARDGPWRQDAFYRAVRRRTGILMEQGKPAGGRFSHDGDNREVWKGDPPAPEAPVYDPDEVTLEVVDLVRSRFGHHPGTVTPSDLPATLEQVEVQRAWAREACFEHFGPYEDAMSHRAAGLFHTRLSALINLHRVLPKDVIDDALAAEIPLNSKEGLVRQIIGWREFVHHVHEATDGFRTLGFERRVSPGNAGWAGWDRSLSDDRADASTPNDGADASNPDGGVDPSTPDGDLPVLPAWWGAPSGLHCLDTAVADVVETGWTHHIPRLMVLANLGTLIGISPRDLTDWFWAAFTDAYDWVVEPNVLAMGTFGVGEVMTTKPYVSGAAYIHRMSDYCGECAFDPKKNCPITGLYWSYLWRNRERLAGNHRTALPLRNVEKRSEERRRQDRRIFDWVRATLSAGEKLEPSDLP